MGATNLSYSGTLILEVKDKKSIKRNSGTSNLFRLFSVIMSREDFTYKNLPTYFMLYNCSYAELVANPSVESNTSYQLLNNFLDMNSYSTKDELNFNAVFTSTLSTAMLLNTTEAYPYYSLAIISGDKTSILAAVDFESDVYDVVKTGGQSLIKWIMTVTNKEETSTT